MENIVGSEVFLWSDFTWCCSCYFFCICTPTIPMLVSSTLPVIIVSKAICNMRKYLDFYTYILPMWLVIRLSLSRFLNDSRHTLRTSPDHRWPMPQMQTGSHLYGRGQVTQSSGADRVTSVLPGSSDPCLRCGPGHTTMSGCHVTQSSDADRVTPLWPGSVSDPVLGCGQGHTTLQVVAVGPSRHSTPPLSTIGLKPWVSINRFPAILQEYLTIYTRPLRQGLARQV